LSAITLCASAGSFERSYNSGFGARIYYQWFVRMARNSAQPMLILGYRVSA
jgi:hypothetical protein